MERLSSSNNPFAGEGAPLEPFADSTDNGVVRVRPDLRTNLCEEVEQWVVNAEGIQVELRTALWVDAVVDPEFERPLDVDDLAKEVKEAKEWLGSLMFTVDPEFLNEPEVEGSIAKAPQRRRRREHPDAEVGQDRARSTATSFGVEQPHAPHQKGWVNAQVAEVDKIPQSVVKQGYPEHTFLRGWKIFIGPEMVMKPAKCGQCLHYSHTCSGQVRKMCGRGIRDRQACVSPEEYEAKEEKDAREAEAREWGMKGKGKDKGLTVGTSLISSKGILDTFEGTRTSMLVARERVEELVERTRGGPGDD
ncbi:hypothetical protein JB92DRAFT_3128534 [Gautieria morchelliformis]|nr:hypothetical protein JB92DRAFT_3128534 [Gautieria morchelliformis]